MSKKQLSLISLLLYGGLILFGTGRFSWATAAWFASIFGLYFLYTFSGKRRFVWFYLVSWIALSVGWYGATPIFGVAHFLFMGVNALIGMVPFMLDRWLVMRFKGQNRIPFMATLVFPLAATAVELLSISGSPLGNFGAAGYSYYSFGPLVQLTAVTGMLGITFLNGWFASVLNWVLVEGWQHPQFRLGVGVHTIILLLVFGYGAVRLWTAPEPETAVSISSFTLAELDIASLNELAQNDREAFRVETQAMHARYLAQSRMAATEGAQIVLWPEGAGFGLTDDVEALLAEGKLIAQEHGIYLAIPSFTIYPDGEETAVNQLQIIDPQGQIALTHVKFGGNFIEGTLAGSGELQTLETPYGTLSGTICWDTDFPNVVRQAGAQGVDILLSPSKDWAAINPLHAHMAAFRGVENGLTVIRQSDSGLSLVSDAYGRTLATDFGEVNMMSTAVATNGVNTLYPVVGDALGWLAVVGLVLTGIGALVRGRSAAKVPAITQPQQ